MGKMTTTPGQRDALIAIVLEGTGEMPGCRSDIIATAPSDEDAIWITVRGTTIFFESGDQ
jgi:hypothetical protein